MINRGPDPEIARQERESAAASFACWYVAGGLEAKGLEVERIGSLVTVVVGGRTYHVSVTAEPA